MSYPINDTQFRDVRIAKVESGGFTDSEGWSFCTSKDWPAQPAVGMTARFYGRGIGYPVRGLFFDGAQAFYRTEEEDRAKHECEVADRKRKQREEYDAKLSEHKAAIARLPEPFRERIERLQAGNPDFWEFLPYELFCCREAVTIAEALKTAEAVRAFGAASLEEQKRLVPELAMDQHSGNTFGMSVRLAYWYLHKPENVMQEHGALATLVGCKKYGCHS